MAETYDISWRLDRSGNPILPKRAEYVANIVQLLFNTIPGTDEFEPKKGLHIAAKLKQPYEDNLRDSTYESDIIEQFNKYTDLNPINVVAAYLNKGFFVYMEIQYQNQVYKMDITVDPETLTAVLHNQS